MRDDHLVGEGRLFQPDIMLPAQYFAVLRKPAPQGPEYALVIAMLQDAVECLQKYRFSTDEVGRELYDRRPRVVRVGRPANGRSRSRTSAACST